MKLERYNQILQAIVLTGVLGGALLLVGFGAVAFFSNPRGGIRAPSNNGVGAAQTKRTLTLCEPILLPNSPIQLIPIALVDPTEREPTFIGSGPSYSASGRWACGFNSWGTRGEEQNVIVRNATTGQQRLLLDHVALITDSRFPEDKPEGKEDIYDSGRFVPRDILYWKIRDRDSNGDGRIAEGDALVAYVSDLAGTNLEAVSPAEAEVLGETYDRKTNSLFVRIRRDSNGDKRYSAEDEMDLIQVNLNDPHEGVSVIDPAIRKSFMTPKGDR